MFTKTHKAVESDSTSADLKALLHEAEQALSNTADSAGEKFDELRGRLREALDSGKYSLENIKAEAIRRGKQADQLVRDNPYYAVGIAAGVGALIGILVARSYSNNSR
jgi:ElaB/YqjD/DUF883 family membrane-anchored ribosome-binding protein